ncbi:MAG: pyridoxine 5'-phosphate synthase [Verrucomicrobia bacterium]|nr:MAG: pyridoxine 5'-phosphate synthase [Verrucomicrobiota bacterium]
MASPRSLLLGLNIDHAATLRQARYRRAPATCGGIVEPDPVALAQLAERAGADGITAHLREDRRHMQPRDLYRLRECIATRLNLEMACTPAMVRFALELKPDAVCIVPENREEITTEGGLDVLGMKRRLARAINRLADAGIVVSLFIDPDPAHIDAAAELGAPFIELHTGAYANGWHDFAVRAREFKRLYDGAERAHELGLMVNAGHGINYVNIGEVRTLPHLHELNIGHAILSRALFSGIEEAVREMKARMNGA